MSKKEVIFEINGFQLKTNSIYKIADKFDAEAPSGFVEEGVTKLPSEGVGNTVYCRFISTNPSDPSVGIWDTGLYQQSPCYEDLEDDKISEQVAQLEKFIVKPFSKKYGAKVDLDPNDDDFWNTKPVYLTAKRTFNTAKIDDLLELYIAMRNYSLTPKGSEGDPAYSDSQYLIVDSDKNTEFKKNQASEEIDAYMHFGRILSESNDKLIKVLMYVGLNVTNTMDPDNLKYTFKEHLSTSKLNSAEFNKLCESLSDPRVEDKITLYKVLVDKYKNGTNITRKSNGKFYFDNTEIGESLKNAAENISISKDLEKIKEELFGL